MEKVVLTQEKLTLFSNKLALYGSASSIVSIILYMLEKLFSELRGAVLFGVLFCYLSLFLLLIFFSVKAYLFYRRSRELIRYHKHPHKIAHAMRNAIADLNDLEFISIEEIPKLKDSHSLSLLEDRLESDREKIFNNFANKLTNSVVRQLEAYFSYLKSDETCRVTIKIIDPVCDNQLDWEVATAYRDPSTFYNMDEEYDTDVHKIRNNDDYHDIVVGRKNAFACNDLSKLAQAGKYKNSGGNWQERYNSTIVVPIRYVKDKREAPLFFGFLAADSKNIKKMNLFSDQSDHTSFQIMAHAADCLATWFLELIENEGFVESCIENQKEMFSTTAEGEI